MKRAVITDVWREQPGRWFCIASRSPWGEEWFQRDELDDVADYVREEVEAGRDVYWSPHGYTRRRRIKANAVMPRLLWADLDEVDPGSLGKLRPTIAIRSSPGRYVGLWLTDSTISEALNRALTYRVGADRGGWALTKVLRVPGTRNFKYAPAPRVRVLWDDGPRYRLAALERRLDVNDEGHTGAGGGFDIDPTQHDAKDVFERYRRALHPKVRALIRHSRVVEADRSAQVYHVIKGLSEAGASADEIAAVVWRSPYFVEKWGQNVERLAAEMARVLR